MNIHNLCTVALAESVPIQTTPTTYPTWQPV